MRLLAVVLIVCGAMGAVGEDEICQARVVLVVPADVKIPKGYQSRIDAMVNYTENFFGVGLKRWGHKNLVSPFRRQKDGHVEVIVIEAKKKATEYIGAELRQEALPRAREISGANSNRQVWWLMVYLGGTPVKDIQFTGFVGGFAPIVGGWSVCIFDDRPGRITTKQSLGSSFLKDLKFKGMIHELGHGFQLPHIGLREGDRSGNTLMGPTFYNYEVSRKKHEPRVYLSQASAAMLSQHPAFNGLADTREGLPQVKVTDEHFLVSKNGSVVRVNGVVESNVKPIYAIVADESEGRPGEYWTKHYVSKVTDDGHYSIDVTEPGQKKGVLKTWFVFEDGAMTGNGKQRGKKGARSRAYKISNKRYRFN